MTEKKLLNWEQILQSFKWGWSARIEKTTGIIEREYFVVGISEVNGRIVLREYCDNQDIFEKTPKEMEKFKITGYLYAGQLAGSDPIPEGQKFKVKETGEILEVEKSLWESFVYTKGDKWSMLDKAQLEPYFE